MTTKPIPAPAPTLEPAPHPGPWWATAPQVGMTQLAITDHQARMSAAKITGRPSVPDGWR